MQHFKFFILASWIFLGISIASYSQPKINNIRQFADTVGLYEKFELILRIEADFANPFDPDEIDIMATFTAPSGKQWKVPAFYNQTFWSGFNVRFSPNEKGIWNYAIHIKDKDGEVTSDNRSFTAVPSAYHGAIRVSQNKRYLEYDDGTPFFGVGLWYNGMTNTEVLDDLKDRGVNFISRFITPLETRGTGLGRYDQLLCSRIDELLEELEKREMLLSLNLWFHSFLSETVWGGFNVAWPTNPYQMVTPAKDFYSSDKAWEYQEKLYRYFIARWGYSRSMAIWFVVDEVNGTDGWALGDSLAAGAWGKKVHDYFKKHDPWQHLTTGTRSGGINEWWQDGYKAFDMAGREIYEAQGFPIITDGQIESSEIHPLTYSYRNYAGQVQKLWNGFEKPAIIPETGWDHVFYEMSMPGYKSQYHNALWVTLANGTAMSPFWWSYSRALNDNVVTYQLLNFRNFVNQIPFNRLTNVKPLEINNSEGDAYAIGSDQLIFGWAVNAKTDMAGKTVTLPNIAKGKYKLRLYHTWSGRFLEEGDQELESNGKTASFNIPILKIKGSHAGYIGQDVAFILEPVK